MTREEAREEIFVYMRSNCYLDAPSNEACEIAIEALSPVSREQVEKAWMGCKYCDEEWGTCNPITNRFTMPPRGGIRFCPMCGRPLTDEAVEIRLKELEALKDV